MAANFDAFEVFPDIVGAVASRPGIFSWRVFFIDDRGGGDGGGGPAEWRIHRASWRVFFIDDRGGGDGGGGGGPAEWRIHRASRQILDGEREQEEGGGEKRIRVEGTRFLNSFVRNRYPVPKSASLRDICTHTRVGNREREKERKTK